MVPTTSEQGIALIKQFEGCALSAYLCPAHILTIGYGHTGDVSAGQTITQEEAERLLKADLEKFERGVSQMVTVELSPQQFDALVSFAFNLGLGNLKTSTLLKKLNSGDYQGAADEFLRWNKAAGKVMAGLTKRREAERALFLS